jgi:hypothetical protein
MRRVATACLALLACHTLPPQAPPTPVVRIRHGSWLVDDSLRISTSWHGRCVRKTVHLDEIDGSSDDEPSIVYSLAYFFPPLLLTFMHWETSTVDCDGQSYAVEVRCDPACVQLPTSGPPQLANDGEVRLMVREPGRTRISIALHNRRTKEVFETSRDIQFFDANHIELQCFDPLEDRYLSCADQDLDPEYPYVRVVLDDGTVLKADLNASGHAIDVATYTPEPSSRLSLDDVLRVRPLPPGPYDVELRLRSAIYTRPRKVSRRVQVREPALRGRGTPRSSN